VCALLPLCFYFSYPPFESLIISLGESDDLVLLDAEPADPVLEAGSLPKFYMHIHKSSLTEIQVEWLTRCYGIPADLHPRVVSEGMTMNALPNDALGLYAHHFQQGGLRAAPIAMVWRHHDSSVTDPFPKSNEYNASDVAKLREDSKGKVLSMAEFLRLPNFKGCKITAGALLPAGVARVTHLANPAATLEDIPPKTADMTLAEIPCRRVLDNKEKKRKKVEEKATANSPVAKIQVKVGIDKGVGKDGPRKKRKIRARPQVQHVSEHVSSPAPLSHAKPLDTLANEGHVSPLVFSKRMGVLRDQTDEHVTPRVNAGEAATREEVYGYAHTNIAVEGHRDNEEGLSGLKTQPTPIRRPSQHPEAAEKLARDKVVLDEEASYFVGRFGNLPFTPQWGLTDSSRMDNSRECRDMMSNLFTPADHEFFNEGVRDESAIRRSWKMLCQSAQQQANTLLRFEALKEEHANLVYAHESCKDVKVLWFVRRVHKIDLRSKRRRKRTGSAECKTPRSGEMVRQRIINQYLLTFVRRLHQSAEYKRSLGRAFSLAVGKGFIDGISIGRKDADIQAILKATPEVDPTSSDVFISEYENLFDQRYPYVDKVTRMYLLDPSGLQNIMPDETSPTPGGGHRDTPTASYA
nr:hypothetical protein [Tanacetum cinerariifolium]